MESTLGLAFIFLLVLFGVVLYLVRETVPPVRTIGSEQKEIMNASWETSFHSITPNFVLTPGALQSIRAPAAKPIRDASGNIL